MDHRAKEHTFSQAYHQNKITSWLDRGGDINVTSFSKHGHTMLMTACIQNHEALTEELLRRGAAVDLKAGGKTALMHAATMGNARCVQLLLEAGADPLISADVDDSDYTENDGLTPLEMVELDIAHNGMRPRHQQIRHMLMERVDAAMAARGNPSGGGGSGGVRR